MNRRTPTLLAAAAAAAMAIAMFPAQAGRFSFAQEWYLQTIPGGTWSVVVADLDGDGRDDIAYLASTGVATPAAITVAWQRSDGTLSIEQVASVSSAIHHLHAADVDGDGASELLGGHATGIDVYDIRTTGHDLGHFASSVPCHFLASGDVDLDGAVDVYCQGTYGAAELVFGLAGVGLASSRVLEVPGFGGSGSQVLIADANDDGLPDLVVADGGHNALYVLHGDGTGAFEPSVAYPLPGDNVSGSPTAAVADFDGDGANEVVIVQRRNSPDAALFVLRTDEDGFLHHDETLQALDMPGTLIAEDMDGDGSPELLVAHDGWSTVSRYIGSGDGLWPIPYFSHVKIQQRLSGIATGDVNSDGQRDVVVANSIGTAVLYGGRAQMTDLDGDLVSDLVWRHDSGRNTVWLAADPALTLPIPTLAPGWSLVPLGKVEHYGGTSFLFRHVVTGENMFWSGNYDAAQPISGAGRSWRLAGAGDFDADGTPDVLWRNLVSGQNVLWLDGELSSPRWLHSVRDQGWAIAGIGDFDGDGRSDILWRHGVSGANVVWPGADRARQQRLPGASMDWAVAGIGDFDRDGHDDIAWRNANSGRNAIWRSANPTLSMPIRAVTDTAWQIASVGDYNGDGHSDLAWRHSGNGRNTIWLGADAQRQMPVQRVGDTRWRIVP